MFIIMVNNLIYYLNVVKLFSFVTLCSPEATSFNDQHDKELAYNQYVFNETLFSNYD